MIQQNNLEKICRTYAFVEARDSPYNKDLSQLQENIQSKYEDAKNSYNKNQDEIEKVMGELEGLNSINLSFNLRSLFNKGIGNGYDLEESAKLGSLLLKSKDKLRLFQKIVNDSYNKNAALVHELSIGMKQTEDYIKQYGENLEETGKKLEDLHNLHTNPEELKKYLNEIINKEKREKISKDKKSKLVNYLMAQGEEEIRSLSRRYLEIKNDLTIAQNLFSYKPLIEKYNQLTDSFEVIRKRLNGDIIKVDEVLLIYELITKSEIDCLRNINLPDKYIEAVNNLISGMEKIDEKFADRLLENYFGNGKSSKFHDFSLNEVVHGLLRHIKQKEKVGQNG